MTNEQIKLYHSYHASTDTDQRYEIAKKIIESQKENPMPVYWDNISDVVEGEEWLPINVTGFESNFLVSSFGRMRRLFRTVGYRNGTPKKWEEKIMVPKRMKQDILRWTLYVNNVKKQIISYRATALTFIPNPENKPTINHIDGNRLNCHILNLEWATWSENELHSHRVLGKISAGPKGEKAGAYKGKVGRYSLDGVLLESFNSREDTEKSGYNYQHVGAVISGVRKSHAGFIWKSLN